MNGSDVAAFACVNRETWDAVRASRAYGTVRVARDGTVHPPASGTYDAEVAPGSSVRDAIDRVPRGGCVLLRPGFHEFRGLEADDAVHVFGPATSVSTVFRSLAAPIDADDELVSVVGITFLRKVEVRAGWLRFQRCKMWNEMETLCDGGASPTFDACHFLGGGMCFLDQGTRVLVRHCVIQHALLAVMDGAHVRMLNNHIYHSPYDNVIHVRDAGADFIGNALFLKVPNSLGISVVGAQNAVLVESNTIVGCAGSLGMTLVNSKVCVVDNVFRNNKTSVRVNSADVDVRGNLLIGTGDGRAVEVVYRGDAVVSCNEIAHNRIAVCAVNAGRVTVEDNVVRDNAGIVGVIKGGSKIVIGRNKTSRVLCPVTIRWWHVRALAAASAALAAIQLVCAPRNRVLYLGVMVAAGFNIAFEPY